MMKIWQLNNELSGFESFQLVNKDDVFLKDFRKEIRSGKKQYDKFANLKVEILDVGEKGDFPNFWSCHGLFVVSEQAKKCLQELIKNSVEFIPILLEDVTFYIINILSIIDAIDYENATFRKLSTGLVVGLEQYSFLKEKIEGLNIFVTTLNGHIHSTEVFVTSEFKDAVEKNNLKGFKFVEVWDSEN